MNTNEKVCPAQQCQTDHKENISTPSIPQQLETLSIEMESVERDPIGLDSFMGNIRSFKLYLKAQLIFLNAGVIAP